ncbi:MAG: tRNA (adenosine(37)-N6)-dimethylallyltransferase MiaA [bacterium]|nr:tRNA (adenosine(37)-N6)-dimethylallyltransferase MiaA [bacterium]
MKSLLCIVGPTAVGKTAIGVQVAERLNAEIISVDSRQIYKDFCIGTAQPSEEERLRVVHHFVNIQSVLEPMTAGRYGESAREKIVQLTNDNKEVILVGGSGLYYAAIFGKIFPSPKIDPKIRNQLRYRAKQEGTHILHQELAAIDPESASKIHPNDYPRIERALEVFLATGKRISQFWKESTNNSFPFQPYTIGLMRQRAELVKRIEKRTEELLQNGWIEEVKKLMELGYSEAIEDLKFHGYREILHFLEGKLSYNEMISEINRVTRQYAKRQMTWFRHRMDTYWIELKENVSNSEIADQILQLYNQYR